MAGAQKEGGMTAFPRTGEGAFRQDQIFCLVRWHLRDFAGKGTKQALRQICLPRLVFNSSVSDSFLLAHISNNVKQPQKKDKKREDQKKSSIIDNHAEARWEKEQRQEVWCCWCEERRRRTERNVRAACRPSALLRDYSRASTLADGHLFEGALAMTSRIRTPTAKAKQSGR